jgi:hypothetical protein
LNQKNHFNEVLKEPDLNDLAAKKKAKEEALGKGIQKIKAKELSSYTED